MAQGYTGEEKTRMRHGFQCPECFGARTESISNNPFERSRYQCIECGAQWFASAAQFQSSESFATGEYVSELGDIVYPEKDES